MMKNVINLKKQINSIILNDYIELPDSKFINMGLLLEEKLGLESNSFSVADINGIELKVLKKNSIYPIYSILSSIIIKINSFT